MLSPFVVLMAAIGIEVGATTVLPRTRGFHDVPWSIAVLGGYALSIWLLAVVVRHMSVSVAYAVWSGLGTAAIAAVEALYEEWGADDVETLSRLGLLVEIDPDAWRRTAPPPAPDDVAALRTLLDRAYGVPKLGFRPMDLRPDIDEVVAELQRGL